MQSNIRGLGEKLNFTDKAYNDRLNVVNDISQERYYSGLENHTSFQNEFSTNFLNDYLKNSQKPEETLNHLATAMCIELYSMDIFKKMVNTHLMFRNSFVALLNSPFTASWSTHTLIYSGDNLKTTEGIAFYFQNYEFLKTKRSPSLEKIEELKNLAKNTLNDEVKLCAEWVVNLVNQNNEIEEYKKIAKVGNPLLTYINNTLKKYPDFRKNCFGISKFRTSIINLMNESLIDDLKNSKNGLLVDESEDYVRKSSIIIQEFVNRETTLKQSAELYNKIFERLTIIRNSGKNRIEFIKKFENLEFNASSVIPFTMKDYQKYMQETFESQFPKKVKIDPIVKTPKSLPKNTKQIQKNPQKKKPTQKNPVIFHKIESKSENLEQNQPLNQNKSDSELLPKSPMQVNTTKSTITTPQAKITSKSPTEKTPKAAIFQYANRVIEWFKEEPFHLKGTTYQHLGFEEKFKQKVYHGFSLKVDEFIKDYSFIAEWDNSKTHEKDCLFCIPGEIQFKNEVERGLFTFCQGINGIVYHRHFTKKATQDLLKYADPAFRKVDFPSLEESMLMEKGNEYISISMPNDMDDLVELQKYTDLIRITDRRHGVQLVLFKTQK